KDDEHPAPANAFDQFSRDGWRDAGPQERRGQHESLAAASFARREPALKDAGGVRQRPGLAGAEQKANGQQAPEADASAGEGGEHRPADDDPRQDATRAETVAPVPRRDFE